MKLFRKKNKGKTVLFLHIPKCAGSTLSFEIIKNQFAQGKYIFFYDQGPLEIIERVKKMPKKDQKKLECIAGHFFFGIHNYYTAKPTTYITVLREPIERIISHYYFVLRSTNHYLHKAVTENNLTLKEYVENRLSNELNNGQTRILAGLEQNVPFGKCHNDLLNRAKENLEKHFSIVGLTERFNDFLHLVNQKLGWDIYFKEKQNVTKNRLRKEEIDNETIAIIERYNQLDIELYEYVRTIFNKQYSILSGEASGKENTFF